VAEQGLIGGEAVAMFADRKTKALAVVLACVIAIVCFGTLYFVGDLARFQGDAAVREGQAALRGLHTPDQLDQLLRQHPSNGILKLVALASRDYGEIDDAARGLLREKDPADLWARMEKGFSSRGDLEALGRDLKAAEDNAAGLEARYAALSKAVRDRIEHDASALDGQAGTLAKFMAVIDAQHAGMTAVMARIAAARLDYFRAYEKCVAVLTREFGTTKIVNGQYIFRFQPQADIYNEAAAAMASAAKRLADLDTERTALRSSQLDKWKSLAAG
jgi:hypothetical protein